MTEKLLGIIAITSVVLRSNFFGTRSVPFHEIRNEFRVFRSVPGKIRNEFRFVPLRFGTRSGTPERGTRSSTTLVFLPTLSDDGDELECPLDDI